MKLLKKEWLQLLILAAPFCAAALLWDKLPDRLPIHWNFRGEVDGYAGKSFGVLVMPIVNVALVILISFLPRLDPKCRNYDPETKASIAGVFRICRLAISLFYSSLMLATFSVALGFHLDTARFAAGGVGVMIAVMGNSMGKLRPNWFAGFRTPWSLESRTVWMKTHRLGGRLMVGSGICLFAESLLLPIRLCFLAGVVPMIILVGIVPAPYSYFSYRAEKKISEAVHCPKNF
jgi:uncharacterized membrane protein